MGFIPTMLRIRSKSIETIDVYMLLNFKEENSYFPKFKVVMRNC